MERAEVLILKLQEQYRKKEPVSQLLMTLQLLQQELMQSSASAHNGNQKRKVSVVMPYPSSKDFAQVKEALTHEDKIVEVLNIDEKEIDSNPLFTGTVTKEDRSKMNVCFVMNDATLEEKFLAYKKEKKIVGIKGHRLVGGFRASLYNALPISSVEILVDAMQTFASANA